MIASDHSFQCYTPLGSLCYELLQPFDEARHCHYYDFISCNVYIFWQDVVDVGQPWDCGKCGLHLVHCHGIVQLGYIATFLTWQ